MVEAKRVAGYVGAGVGSILTVYAVHEAFKGFGIYDYLGNLFLGKPPADGDWTDDYRCSGTTRQRQWRYSDGTLEWLDVEHNYWQCTGQPDGGQWTDNYKCMGRRLLREWLNSDGSREWKTIEDNSAECWVNAYGTIYEEVVMRAIPGAQVKLTGRNHGGNYTAITNASGYFEIENITPDDYDIQTTKTGYTPHDFFNYDATQPQRSYNLTYTAGPLVLLTVGGLVAMVIPSELRANRGWCCGAFWLPRLDEGWLEVQVIRSDGEPFEGAVVEIEPVQRGDGGFMCPHTPKSIMGKIVLACGGEGKCSARYFGKYEGGGDHPNTRQVKVSVIGYKTGPYSYELFDTPVVQYTQFTVEGSLGALTCWGQCEKNFYKDGECWNIY